VRIIGKRGGAIILFGVKRRSIKKSDMQIKGQLFSMIDREKRKSEIRKEKVVKKRGIC